MLWIPMAVMLAVTLTALAITVFTKFGGLIAGSSSNIAGDVLQSAFAVTLLMLGVVLAVQGVKKLFGREEK